MPAILASPRVSSRLLIWIVHGTFRIERISPPEHGLHSMLVTSPATMGNSPVNGPDLSSPLSVRLHETIRMPPTKLISPVETCLIVPPLSIMSDLYAPALGAIAASTISAATTTTSGFALRNMNYPPFVRDTQRTRIRASPPRQSYGHQAAHLTVWLATALPAGRAPHVDSRGPFVPVPMDSEDVGIIARTLTRYKI